MTEILFNFQLFIINYQLDYPLKMLTGSIFEALCAGR